MQRTALEDAIQLLKTETSIRRLLEAAQKLAADIAVAQVDPFTRLRLVSNLISELTFFQARKPLDRRQLRKLFRSTRFQKIVNPEKVLQAVDATLQTKFKKIFTATDHKEKQRLLQAFFEAFRSVCQLVVPVIHTEPELCLRWFAYLRAMELQYVSNSTVVLDELNKYSWSVTYPKPKMLLLQCAWNCRNLFQYLAQDHAALVKLLEISLCFHRLPSKAQDVPLETKILLGKFVSICQMEIQADMTADRDVQLTEIASPFFRFLRQSQVLSHAIQAADLVALTQIERLIIFMRQQTIDAEITAMAARPTVFKEPIRTLEALVRVSRYAVTTHVFSQPECLSNLLTQAVQQNSVEAFLPVFSALVAKSATNADVRADVGQLLSFLQPTVKDPKILRYFKEFHVLTPLTGLGYQPELPTFRGIHAAALERAYALTQDPTSRLAALLKLDVSGEFRSQVTLETLEQLVGVSLQTGEACPNASVFARKVVSPRL